MMKSKTTITLSIAAIAAAALSFATGPIVRNQQALAYGWRGTALHYILPSQALHYILYDAAPTEMS
jgi:hypothetical protein